MLKDVFEILQKYRELQIHIAIFGMEELSDEDVYCIQSKKGSEIPFSTILVAEILTGTPGRFVPVKETIEGFKAILDGEMDDYPQAAFFNVGNIDDVKAKAEQMAKN